MGRPTWTSSSHVHGSSTILALMSASAHHQSLSAQEESLDLTRELLARFPRSPHGTATAAREHRARQSQWAWLTQCAVVAECSRRSSASHDAEEAMQRAERINAQSLRQVGAQAEPDHIAQRVLRHNAYGELGRATSAIDAARGGVELAILVSAR